MEKYEKPCMEVVEIEEDLTTGAPCSPETPCFSDGLCGMDLSIKS